MKKNEIITVRFVKMKCYKCGTINHLFFVDSQKDEGVHYELDKKWSNDKPSLSPEIISRVEAYAKSCEGKQLNLAKVAERYSHIVNDTYKSFGCSKCDALFGDWYVREAYIESQYEDDPKVVEIEI